MSESLIESWAKNPPTDPLELEFQKAVLLNNTWEGILCFIRKKTDQVRQEEREKK